jgi:histidine phosphotransferase ChpT
MADPVQLAEMVCVRFSHELSGLLGSLSGVLELVAEAQESPTEEMALATETATELMRRLMLLRAAWGGTSEDMDLATLRTRMRGVVGNHRVQLDLDALADGSVFPPPMARLVLNVMLLAGESLPRGGVLALSGDATSQVVAQIAGPGAAWPPTLALCIADETQAWAALGNPRGLQAPLTALIARAMGMRLSLMMATGPAAVIGAPPPLVLAPRGN